MAENVLDREFGPDRPNTRWRADITPIPTREGWLYLAVVGDPFSRRVVGRSVDPAMTSRLVVDALEMALVGRLKGPRLRAWWRTPAGGASTRASTTSAGCVRSGSHAA